MIILWIRKSKKDKQEAVSRDEKQSFREHDEVMKKFRLAHQALDAIPAKDILTDDGNLLAPVYHVKLPEHANN